MISSDTIGIALYVRNKRPACPAPDQAKRVLLYVHGATYPAHTAFDLPLGATPVDFAYRVHTGVGHRTRGALVNGQIVPLDHKLATGDRVEILTHKKEQPSRDWLSPQSGFLASPRNRARG